MSAKEESALNTQEGAESQESTSDISGGSQNNSLAAETGFDPKIFQSEAFLTAVDARAEEKAKTLYQKISDKRWSDMEKRQEAQDVKVNRVLELIESGANPKDAKIQADNEEMFRWYQEQTGKAKGFEGESEPLAPQTAASPLNISKALNEAGYDMKAITREDLEFVANFKDQVEATNALIERRINQPPPAEPSPSTVISKTGKTIPAPNVEELAAELDALLQTDSNLPRQEELKKLIQEAGG